MNKYAVIVAGGAGTRMGGSIPKQFLEIEKKPILYYSIQVFLDAFEDINIILVLPPGFISAGKELIEKWFKKRSIQITTGGDTRFQSVRNGLSLIKSEAIIFVHDAVRCLVTKKLVQRCYNQAVKTGSAIPSIAVTDSVRLLSETGHETIDREKVVFIQTPQVFQSNILLSAFQTEFNGQFTDEASVVEAYGLNVTLVEGEADNIKITRPIDLIIAEKILSQRKG